MIITNWFKGLDSSQKESFQKLLYNNSDNMILSRLLTLLKERRDELERQERSSDYYESPSWAFKEADIIGQKKALKFVEDLLNFVERKGK